MGIGGLGAAIGGLAGGYAKGVQIRDEMESNALKREAMQLQMDKARREDEALKEYMSGNKAHDDEWDNGTGRFANYMPKPKGAQPPAEAPSLFQSKIGLRCSIRMARCGRSSRSTYNSPLRSTV